MCVGCRRYTHRTRAQLALFDCRDARPPGAHHPATIFSQIVPFPVGRRQSPALLAFKFADDLSRRRRNKGETDESVRHRIAPITAVLRRRAAPSLLDCRLKSASDRTSRRRRSQFVLVADKSSNLSSRRRRRRRSARWLGQDKTSAPAGERMYVRSGTLL